MSSHIPTPAPPRLRRRQWLWMSGGLAGAGLFGAAWTYFRWRAKAAALENLALEICGIAPPSVPPIAFDSASGLPADAPRPIAADARCPVCGMYPARRPRWAAQALYRDHAAHYFDSPVDLMQFLSHMARYAAGRSAADVRSRWVTDSASGAWVALEQAWFVQGSDALGPMRCADLPAFGDRAQAAEFVRRHGGQALAFNALTPAIVNSLSAERGGGHEHMHGA